MELPVIVVKRRPFAPATGGPAPRLVARVKTVGDALAAGALEVQLGAFTVTNAASLQLFIDALQADAKKACVDFKIGRGPRESERAAVTSYITDVLDYLMNATSAASRSAPGTKMDISPGTPIDEALGLSANARYASTRTPYGKALRANPDGMLTLTTAILAAKMGVLPTQGGVLDVALIDNPDGTKKVPYMSAASFTRNARVGRFGVELEATRTFAVDGMDFRTLSTAMRAMLSAGNNLRRLQRPSTALAFTALPVDKRRWDEEAHTLRMGIPYVAVSIEQRRGLEVDPASGAWRPQMSRDLFKDEVGAVVEVATGVPTRFLRDRGATIRTRERIEGGASPLSQRTLAQSKLGVKVDPVTGVKMPIKSDDRVDGTTAATALHPNLTDEFFNGRFNGAESGPALAVYDLVVRDGGAVDVGPHKAVVQLVAAAGKKQVRDRFHYTETPTPLLVEDFVELGEKKIAEQVARALAAPAVTAAEKKQLQDLAAAIADRSAIIARAERGLRALDPLSAVDVASINALWPDQPVPADELTADKRGVVAAVIAAAFEEVAGLLLAWRERIAGTQDATGARAVPPRTPGASALRDYFRTRAALEAFVAFANTQANAGVVAGQAQTYGRFLKTFGLGELTDAERSAWQSKPKAERDAATQRLTDAGVKADHLAKNIADAAFAVSLPLPAEIAEFETARPLIDALDALLADPQTKAAFVADFKAHLQRSDNDIFVRGAGPGGDDAVLAAIRRRVSADDVRIQSFMISEAGLRAVALGADAERAAYCDMRRQDWGGDFMICSGDACDYVAAKHLGMLREDAAVRTAVKPLAREISLGFEFSTDVQLELREADPYIQAVRRAMHSIVVPLFMEYALTLPGAGVVVTDKATFGKFLSAALAWPAPENPRAAELLQARAAFVEQVATALRARVPDLELDLGALESLLVDRDWENKVTPVDRFGAATPGLGDDTLRGLVKTFAGAKRVLEREVAATSALNDALAPEMVRELAEMTNDVVRDLKREQRNASGTRAAEIGEDLAALAALQTAFAENRVAWKVMRQSKDDTAIDLVIPA